jgi:hypothetical protein
MDLARSFEKFSKLELSRWNRATDSYTPTGIFGALQVYDRFISDRDFGQKKRIFLTPGEFKIDPDQLILKIDSVPSVWMLEGLNHDADSDVYASSVVLREARYRLKLYKPGGEKRASGVGYVNRMDVLVTETYGDFSRYSSSESREMDNIDYTVGSWYLPKGTPVDLDTIIENGFGQRFLVREVSTFLDLLMVRAQEQEAGVSP